MERKPSRIILPSHCLIVYDDYFEDEAAEAHKIALYAYPNEVDVSAQVNLQGMLSAVTAFVRNFVSDAPQVVSFEIAPSSVAVKSDRAPLKLAAANQAGLTFLLAGSVRDSDASLCAHLNALTSAFVFFEGSFAQMAAGLEGKPREALLERSRQCFQRFVPAYFELQLARPTRVLQPQVYLQLPKGSRVFVAASQLLQQLPTLLAPGLRSLTGAVFYAQSVLCSFLHPDITRHLFLLTRSSPHPSFSSAAASSFASAPSTSLSASSSAVGVAAAVAISSSPSFPPSSSSAGQPPSSSASSSASSSSLSMEVQLRRVHSELGQRLLVVQVGQVSLCALCQEGTEASSEWAQRQVSASGIEARLRELEHSVSRLLHHAPPPVQNLHGVSLHRTTPASIPPALGPPAAPPVALQRNELLQAVKALGPADLTEDSPMLAATAAARNLFFMQTPGASQIMLRNHQSAIFCRRTFARETYFYQPVMPGVACSDKGTPFNAALRISFFSIYLYLSLSSLVPLLLSIHHDCSTGKA
jgi:hypothetical protein